MPLFDVVYFLKDGRVVDHGTATELRLRCPPFAKMFDAATSSAAA